MAHLGDTGRAGKRMNYRNHYDRLMDRAKERSLLGYLERHHIVPKCLGGSNAPENIVKLTPEEHYVAHQLLVKMNPGHRGILWSALQMTGPRDGPRRNNKVHGWLRKQWIAAVRNGRLSDETKEKIRAKAIGRKVSVATRAKMSLNHKKRLHYPSGWHLVFSDEHKRKISVARIGRPTWVGKQHTPETRAKMAESAKTLWKKRLEGDLPIPRTALDRDHLKRMTTLACKSREARHASLTAAEMEHRRQQKLILQALNQKRYRERKKFALSA